MNNLDLLSVSETWDHLDRQLMISIRAQLVHCPLSSSVSVLLVNISVIYSLFIFYLYIYFYIYILSLFVFPQEFVYLSNTMLIYCELIMLQTLPGNYCALSAAISMSAMC